MSYSLTTHEIPDFMTRFCHANCMIGLRDHCMPLLHSKQAELNIKFHSVIFYFCCATLPKYILHDYRNDDAIFQD